MDRTLPIVIVLMITAFSLTGCIGNDAAPDNDSEELSIFVFKASEPFGNELGINLHDGKINLAIVQGVDITYSDIILDVSGEIYDECDGTQVNGINCWDRSDNDDIWGLNHHIVINTPFQRNYTVTITVSEFGEEPYGNTILGQTTYTHIFDDEDDDGVINSIDSCPNTPLGELVSMSGCSSSQLDSDDDGVSNADDLCSNTPAGTTVDSTGCEVVNDSDNDGVSDEDDQCSNTPAGTTVDSTGCEVVNDSDNDGVSDEDDQCSNTPAGTTVDSTGCEVVNDSDNDGVSDEEDLCSNTDSGTLVNQNGCSSSQLDTDGDGVSDDKDQCENTSQGVEVDSNGCEDAPDSDGDGVKDNHDECQYSSPDDIVDERGCSIVVKIVGGGSHQCALVYSGDVFCWELNEGSSYPDQPERVLGLPSGVNKAIDIDAAVSHTCVIINDGSMMCWGNNNEGQLGDGTTTDSLSAVSVNIDPTLSVTDISLGGEPDLGYDFTCAITDNESVYCWGNNKFGILAGDSPDSCTHWTGCSKTPILIENLGSTPKQISAGAKHVCVLMQNSSVACWGDNGYGQLGDGSTTDRITPDFTNQITNGVAEVIEISSHADMSCVLLDNNSVMCWGGNHWQLIPGVTSQNCEEEDSAVATPSSIDRFWLGPYAQYGEDYTESATEILVTYGGICVITDQGNMYCSNNQWEFQSTNASNVLGMAFMEGGSNEILSFFNDDYSISSWAEPDYHTYQGYIS